MVSCCSEEHDAFVFCPERMAVSGSCEMFVPVCAVTHFDISCWPFIMRSSTLAYLLTYLLTHSTEQSTSWEANRFSTSQENTRIVWNLKIHNHIHNSPPSVPILSQLDPVHTPTSWISILILSSHLCLGLQSCLFPSDFPTTTLYIPLLSPHMRCMPSPSHSLFYHPNSIGWAVQIIKQYWSLNSADHLPVQIIKLLIM